MFVFGGQAAGQALDDVQVLIPQTLKWYTSNSNNITRLPHALSKASAATMYEGRLWIAGGLRANGEATNTVLSYDSARNTISQEVPLPEAMSQAALATIGSHLVVYGGDSNDSEQKSHYFVYQHVASATTTKMATTTSSPTTATTTTQPTTTTTTTSPPTTTTTTTMVATTMATPVAYNGLLLHRMNSGEASMTRTPDGRLWTSDVAYGKTGGFASTNTPVNAGAGFSVLYRGSRQVATKSPSLQVGLPTIGAGQYTLILYFAETCDCALAIGDRLMNIVANGNSVATNYDILAAAGGFARGVTLTTTVDVQGDEAVQLAIQRVKGNPKLDALEVVWNPSTVQVAPVFETLPSQMVIELGETFFYGIQGFDINPGQQSSLQFAQLDGPANTILSNLGFGTAVLTWTPAAAGNYTVTLQLVDDTDLTATQTLNIEVRTSEAAWRWAPGPSAPMPFDVVTCGVIDNIVYLVGNDQPQTFAYDTLNEAWLDTTGWGVRPHQGHHHAAEVYNGLWYLVGGLGDESDGKMQVAPLYCWYAQAVLDSPLA